MKKDFYKTQRDTLIRLFVEWWFYEDKSPHGKSEANSNYFNQAVSAVPELAHAVNAVLHESSRLTRRAADASLGYDIPDGYDAICGFCHYPFIFKQSKGMGTEKWKEYCSSSCESGITLRSARR